MAGAVDIRVDTAYSTAKAQLPRSRSRGKLEDTRSPRDRLLLELGESGVPSVQIGYGLGMSQSARTVYAGEEGH